MMYPFLKLPVKYVRCDIYPGNRNRLKKNSYFVFSGFEVGCSNIHISPILKSSCFSLKSWKYLLWKSGKRENYEGFCVFFKIRINVGPVFSIFWPLHISREGGDDAKTLKQNLLWRENASRLMLFYGWSDLLVQVVRFGCFCDRWTYLSYADGIIDFLLSRKRTDIRLLHSQQKWITE